MLYQFARYILDFTGERVLSSCHIDDIIDLSPMVDWTQTQQQPPPPPPQQPVHSHPNSSHIEIAAKAYLETNVRYYLQNVNNNTGADQHQKSSTGTTSANRNAATDFIVSIRDIFKGIPRKLCSICRSPLGLACDRCFHLCHGISSTSSTRAQASSSSSMPWQAYPYISNSF
ncbi:unnamed protein product, partial [Oppiella nova]